MDALRLRVGGLDLYARVAGLGRPGTPVVAVHGLGVSSRYLVPTLDAVARHRPAYGPDLPGFGRSASPPRGLGVEELAVALEGWLDAARLDRPLLLANSLGCQVVVRVLARTPGRARAAILTGPTGDPAARTFVRQLPRWLRTALDEPPGLLAVVVAEYARYGPRRFAATARSALADRPEEHLPGVRVPVTVLRGEHDALASPAWAERVAALLPRGRLVTVPGRAHALVWSAPETLAAEVEALLAEEADEGGRERV